YHPVAIAPGRRSKFVELVPIAFTVPGQIEPPPRPANTVLRRGQVAVKHPVICSGSLIADEFVDCLRLGGEASELEAYAPDDRSSVGLRRRREPACFQLIQDEPIDRGTNPVAICYWRRLGPLHRLKRPPVAARPARRSDLIGIDGIGSPACTRG